MSDEEYYEEEEVWVKQIFETLLFWHKFADAEEKQLSKYPPPKLPRHTIRYNFLFSHSPPQKYRTSK